MRPSFLPSFLLAVYPFDKMVSGGEVVEVVCLQGDMHSWGGRDVRGLLVAGFAHLCGEVELGLEPRVCVSLCYGVYIYMGGMERWSVAEVVSWRGVYHGCFMDGVGRVCWG